ncbi:MAG TPA: hypothetical protein VK009_23885 [Chloroflexota bacterium]|nr:hypothetical protein [Chloroflexota bacterium]
MIAANTRAAETLAEINAMANAQFESPEFRQLLGTRFTRERARFFTIQMGRYVANRRDCWGFAQGASPLDVKRLIWAHEQEELVLDPEVGMDHFTLATREAELLGLTEQDFEDADVHPACQAAFYAWIHLAKDRPWLEAVATCSVLEVRNSGAVIQGGSLSSRIKRKFVDELGLPAEQLINTGRHSVADEAHATLLQQVLAAHVHTASDQAAVLRGARESYILDRAFRGALAAGMAALE